MSKITRKTAKLFGSTAGVDQIAQFGSLANGTPNFSTDPATIQALAEWLDGWFAAAIDPNSPAIEDMNAFCYVLAYQICYQMQEGVAEWDSATTYYIGSLVNASGQLYISLTDSNLNHAVSDLTNWRPMSGLVNVKDYGAKGDGVTDDTVAIQNACNALGPFGTNNNFVVYFPTGNYIVSNITIPATIMLLGDGRWQSFITGKTGSTGYMITDQGNGVKIIIRELSFSGNNCNYTDVIRLGFGAFQWGTEGLIENIHIRDCPAGIALHLNANVGTVRSVSIWSVDQGIVTLGNGNYFTDCYIAGFSTYGINAGDSFWTNTELEAPAATAIPFYMNGIVKVQQLLVSLSGSVNIAALFQIDGSHGSDCVVTNLVIYDRSGTGTYSTLVLGTGLTFGLSAPTASTNNAVMVFDGTTGALAKGVSITAVGNVFGAGAQIAGVVNASSVSSGSIGQRHLQQVSSATSVGGTGNYFDCDSMSLTAGNYEIQGVVQYQLNGATMTGGMEAGISTTTGSSSTGLVPTVNLAQTTALPNSTENVTIQTPIYYVQITTTTVYYLKGLANFSAGTPKYVSSFRWVRVP